MIEVSMENDMMEETRHSHGTLSGNHLGSPMKGLEDNIKMNHKE
jgi:hypothetical protein